MITIAESKKTISLVPRLWVRRTHRRKNDSGFAVVSDWLSVVGMAHCRCFRKNRRFRTNGWCDIAVSMFREDRQVLHCHRKEEEACRDDGRGDSEFRPLGDVVQSGRG